MLGNAVAEVFDYVPAAVVVELEAVTPDVKQPRLAVLGRAEGRAVYEFIRKRAKKRVVMVAGGG